MANMDIRLSPHTVLWPLLLAWLCWVHQSHAAVTKCKLKCGVIQEQRGSTSMHSFVSDIWDDLRFARTLNNLDIQFVTVDSWPDITMEELVQAYMQIGSENASAVIGPYTHNIAIATKRFGIPYFVTSETAVGQYLPYNLITVFPKALEVYRIAVDVVQRYGWKEIAIFYETMDGLLLLEELVQRPEVHVRAWKIESTTGVDTLRASLLKVRQLAVTNIIVMTSRAITTVLLDQALKLSMLSNRYSWVLPTLNHDERSLRTYAFTQVNLTTFHLVQNAVTSNDAGGGSFTAFERATIYDSLLTLYRGVALYLRNTASCQWSGKDHLLPTLSQVDDIGATGHLAFRRDGSRQGYVVHILGLNESGLGQIGVWNSSVTDLDRRLQLDDSPFGEPSVLEYPLGKDIVHIVTIQEDPFIRLKRDHDTRTGNDRFEGYCIDLITRIAEMLDFTFHLYLVPDGKFGDKDAEGHWDGMVRELIDGNASIALAPITITSKRESVIDFTKPFKSSGNALLMRRPTVDSSLFQFIDPLSGVVWLLMLAVLVFVSLTLFILDRVAPAEEANLRFSLQESIWYTFSSLVLCGTDSQPRTVAGRILGGSLWFFSLIIISSYTANLAAHLTVSKFSSNIRTMTDLADQSEVGYGTVWGSEVSAFFVNSDLKPFISMWEFMSTIDTSGMVNTSSQGIQKVRDSTENYGFVWDSPVIDYVVEMDCDLMRVGEPIGSKGYGLGVPGGARYRDELTMCILRLSEEGFLQKLETKYWNNPQKCPDFDKQMPTNTRSLHVDKVGGVFIVLAAGLVLALGVGVIDYYVRIKRKKAAKNRKTKEKMDSKEVYDGTITSGLQVEEPFLTSYTTCNNKGRQTNIF